MTGLGATAPLLERGAALSAIEHAISQAVEGRGRFVVLSGDPGAGKSRLLEAAREIAERHGELRILAAGGSELGGEISFGVIIDLLAPALTDVADEERESLLAGAASLSLPVLEGADAEDEELFPRLHGLFWLAQNLAERAPLLLLVDDLHWADAGSLQALLYLLRRIADLPICVICSSRPAEGGPTPELLDELRDLDEAERVEVEPLSRDAVGEMIEALLAEPQREFVDACAQATGGNPFLLSELTAELREGEVAPTDEEAARIEGLAPEAVIGAMLERIAGRGAEALELARAVATFGADVPLRRAATLAGLDVTSAAEWADDLVAAQILAPGEDLSFVHPLVRSSVHEDIAEDVRHRLSREAANLMRDDGEPAERTASLLTAVPPAGDDEAARMLASGGRSAQRRGDPTTAASLLSRALAEPPAPAEREGILRSLGHAEVAAGIDSSIDRLEELVALSDGEERTLDLQTLGRALFANGRHGDAAAIFERARDLVGERDPELSGQLDSEYIAAAFWDADLAEVGLARARELSGPDLDRSLTLPERELLVTVAAQKMFAVEDRETSLTMALRAMGDRDELALEEGSEGQAVHVVGGVLLAADEFSRYERFMTTAIAEARRRGSVMAFASTSYSRIAPRLELGLLDGAVADAEAAIDSRRYGWNAWLPGAYALLVEVQLLRAELEACHAALDELELEEGSPWAAVISSVRGKLAMAEGDPAAARAHFQAWGDGWFGRNPAIFGDWRSFAAIASAALGDRDEAITLAKEELELSRDWGAPRPIAVALRSLGIATGGEEGIEILREAVSTLEGSEAIVERSRVLTDLGRELREAGAEEEAREPLREALDIAHRCGAASVADRAYEELRRAGAKPRRRARTGLASLTAGERQVAALLADGLNGREIAEALFVTPKTVDWHVQNASRKLGVSGRAEVAAAVLKDAD